MLSAAVSSSSAVSPDSWSPPDYLDVLFPPGVAAPKFYKAFLRELEKEQRHKALVRKQLDEEQRLGIRGILYPVLDEKKLKETWWTRYAKPTGFRIVQRTAEYEEKVEYEEKGGLFYKTVPVFETTWNVKMSSKRGKRRAYPESVVEQMRTYFGTDNGELMRPIAEHVQRQLTDKVNLQWQEFSYAQLPRLTNFHELPTSHVMYNNHIYAVETVGLKTVLFNSAAPMHKMQVELNAIPPKYRYRSNTIMFIPDFIKFKA